ncbi:DUF2178 domain-containing protein [Thermoanaerobacterium thermosaccharolyticum]|uniref:DUF2178 domain-containing protein n=1 Tax=Thermoanaerobacterium TaxID=28895 RepID=UPI0026E0E399|nr:DUF2178 domain-containing protein [Thermoanaerobacterium sp. CMT5567-10]WKV08571.1 DUF2178 domain-containing protein [Thermoanaerobacterium sp. CMT5567-10]
MKNKSLNYCMLALIGMILFLIGVILMKNNAEKYIYGLFMGLGLGIFIIFGRKAEGWAVEKKYPDIKRHIEIEINDERNTIIRDKAGSKTNQIMNYLLLILTIIFNFMDVSLYVVLSMVALIITQGVLFIIFSNQYEQKL